MIRINNQVIPAIQGYGGTDTITDDLETMVVMYDSESIEGFEPFDIATIQIPGLNKSMIVAEETATTIQRNPVRYRHTVTLIEPTKYLEKITTPAMAFTNKDDTLIQQLEKLLYKVEITTTSPRFILSLDLKSRLANVPGEEFFFEPNNLRNVLDEMLSVVGIRCKIKVLTTYDAIYIDYVDQNKVGNKIDEIRAVTRTMTQNIEYLAGNIETYATNALSGNRKSIWHPFEGSGFWDCLRTTEPVLTTNNAQMIFTFKLEEIKKLFVKCNIKFRAWKYYSNGLDSIGDTTITEEFDISDYVVVKEIYDLLPDRAGSDAVNEQKSQELSQAGVLVYERGSNVVTLGTYKIIFGFEIEKLRNAIGKRMNTMLENYPVMYDGELVIPDIITVLDIITSYSDILFKAEYVPYVDTHAKIGKQNITNPILAKTSVYDNQSEKVIDLDRFGLNLYGKINKIGNKELTIDTTVNSFDKLFNVGDIYNDYVVVSRTYQIFKEFIKVQYKLSKDYNNISERIAINRERRLYNIPIENLKRDIFIKDYILASTAPLSVPYAKQSLLNSYGLKTFLDTLKGPFHRRLFAAIVQTKTKSNTIYGPFELPFYSYPMANTLNFKTRFLDNYSVGFSVQAKDGQILGGKKVVHNRYVDDIGECAELTINLACGKNFVIDFEPQIAIAKALPNTDLSYYSGFLISNEKNYKIEKDAFEHLELTYTIEVRPSIADHNIIVIGEALLEKNDIYDRIIKGGIKVYVSNDTYSVLENQNLKSNSTEATNATITVNSDNTVTINNLNSYITENTKSWAIGDADGDLYLACNDINQHIIYFYSSNDLL